MSENKFGDKGIDAVEINDGRTSDWHFLDRGYDKERLARRGFRWLVSHNQDYTVRSLACTELEAAGFVNLFSSRIGGVSPMPADALNLAGFNEDEAANIHENRRRFLSVLDDGEKWRLATIYQTHSADVHRFESAGDEVDNDKFKCDALTIDTRANPLTMIAVKTADCVPILLGDARTGAAASIHAGWRGTLSNIVTRTIEAMRRDYGTRGEDVIAAIGAAALGCCYEVGDDVIDAFLARDGKNESLFIPTRPRHARIDLHLANKQELLSCGVREANIYLAPFCTMHDNDLFFSYRKEKHLHGKVGRLMASIGSEAK